MSNPQPPAQTNPVGAGVVVSGAVKAVLLALAATHVLPWDGEQVGTVTLAVSAVVDAGIYLGFIRPRIAIAQQAAVEQRVAQITGNPPQA